MYQVLSIYKRELYEIPSLLEQLLQQLLFKPINKKWRNNPNIMDLNTVMGTW